MATPDLAVLNHQSKELWRAHLEKPMTFPESGTVLIVQPVSILACYSSCLHIYIQSYIHQTLIYETASVSSMSLLTST